MLLFESHSRIIRSQVYIKLFQRPMVRGGQEKVLVLQPALMTTSRAIYLMIKREVEEEINSVRLAWGATGKLNETKVSIPLRAFLSPVVLLPRVVVVVSSRAGKDKEFRTSDFSALLLETKKSTADFVLSFYVLAAGDEQLRSVSPQMVAAIKRAGPVGVNGRRFSFNNKPMSGMVGRFAHFSRFCALRLLCNQQQ